jgi:8-oxo-dGTP diphosphatase
VVAAVIRDGTRRILLSTRPGGRHMAGLWEFPGGKVRPAEPLEQALVREVTEELGVTIQVEAPLTFATHEDSERRLLLLFYAASLTNGAPRPLEGQRIAWVEPASLPDYPMPPADARLVAQLAGCSTSDPER